MPGMFGSGFNGLTPQERRAAMAKRAAEERKRLQQFQQNHQMYGTQDPILINIQKQQAAAQQQAMQNQQVRNQQMQQQAANQMQQNQNQDAMREYIHRMSQTLQGRQELQRRGIRY